MVPALQALGSVGLRLYVSGIGAASTVAFEDYRVVALR
ncbi:hypothetical protein CLV49_0559 [Labedella gwakjiensis]|uniref:Uncharacterized protein n=1 Tax=Labedella gwakjiensis TaxID=390269 RepID=A0A2P8GSM2_9MICO|nr:hypothetical protein CLV49_0559 [Labedella gwakjiensis]